MGIIALIIDPAELIIGRRAAGLVQIDAQNVGYIHQIHLVIIGPTVGPDPHLNRPILGCTHNLTCFVDRGFPCDRVACLQDLPCIGKGMTIFLVITAHQVDFHVAYSSAGAKLHRAGDGAGAGAESRFNAAVGEQRFLRVFAVGAINLHTIFIIPSCLGIGVEEGVFRGNPLRGMQDRPLGRADKAAFHLIESGVGAHLVDLPGDPYTLIAAAFGDIEIGKGGVGSDAGSDGVA